MLSPSRAANLCGLYAVLISLGRLPHRNLTPQAPHSRRNMNLKGGSHDRPWLHCSRPVSARRPGALRQSPDAGLREISMFEPLLGLAVAIGLGVYLIFALLNPERF
ncbi:K(+)-transporting ATPase subunit F [Rhodoblastus sp.]|uniref:K(+)-transporting ATPase subunit F n=1 Tax=Rhodoblastus sp. TaxID=1962975 RepID=UPI003F9CAC25